MTQAPQPSDGGGPPRYGAPYGSEPGQYGGHYGAVGPPPSSGAPSDPAQAPPVCPRHPDRVSYVRCQRCNRPTCPECQRQAAVGFQCVDCVREQAGTVREARTIFGGAITGQAGQVSKALIAICVIVYALEWLLPNRVMLSLFAYAPDLTLSEPWRLITAAFLHSPSFLLHIVFNMYALWLTGPYLEQLLGRARFAALYLVTAIGGSVGVLLLASPNSQSWITYTVGASGAVFGLWGAMLVLERRMNRSTGGIIGLLVINGVLGFMPGLSIAWQAHLGGLITGVLVGLVYAYTPAERRKALHPAGIAAILVLLVALIAIKVSMVPAGLI